MTSAQDQILTGAAELAVSNIYRIPYTLNKF
jgi:hypothetical protein